MTTRPEPLEVLAVCGLGMGTSLILKMTADTVFDRLGIRAHVTNTDLSSARGMSVDVLVGQGMHMSELEGMAPVVVTVDDFIDDAALEAKLVPALTEQGWL